MPVYEYRCTNTPYCLVDMFEVVLWPTDVKEGLTPVCPNCGKPATRCLSTFGGKFGDTRRFHGER